MKHPNELDQQIENLRTLQQSYDAIAGAAEAYNTGKEQLAANLEFKGVQASASETLPELANKVAQIAQETTIYEGADSYGKQLSADGALWDLYQVLADMKTRFMGTGDYAALIVCEFYKGYDSLQLQGADGYYTCDGDYYDYASPNHVWHDADNGKMNRWVAFLYHDEGARLDITNTSISPRSMYIGGHIGTIEYFVNGRLTDLVCGIEETDVLDNFLSVEKSQAWSKNVNLLNVSYTDKLNIQNGGFVNISGLGSKTVSPGDYLLQTNAQYIHIKADSIIANGGRIIYGAGASIIGIVIEGDLQAAYSLSGGIYWAFTNSDNFNAPLKYFYAPDFKGSSYDRIMVYGTFSNLEDVLVGEANYSIIITMWNAANVIADANAKARLINNIKNHILARVKDMTGISQPLFEIATSMFNAIKDEQIEWQGETMTLADAFLTKNWLLAGA